MIDAERLVRVSGYGMRCAGDGYLFRPTSVEEVRAVFDLARRQGRQVVLRGAGRSYGDANIGRECLILDITRMRRILNWDPSEGILDCEGGVTIEDVWRATMEDGYWPAVVSGTMFPTLAGALAMNIHGKNNYRVGTIGEHVDEIDVVFPTGELRTVKSDEELFRAIVGGAGLLGVIVRVRLKMHRVRTGDVRVLATSPRTWQEQIDTFERYEADADYMVSWIDCFARGERSGRGQFHAAWYVDGPEGFHASLRPDRQDLPDTILGLFPKSMVWRLLKPFNRRLGMRMINAAKDFSGRKLGDHKVHIQSLVAFSFLLDYVPNWRRTYEPGGFIQFQSFVPREKAREVFSRQIEMQQATKLESFLGVMKRHRPDRFLFSHAVDGYSLAMDFKATSRNWPRLRELCEQMSDLVVANGGRLYFAKDGTMLPRHAKAYLGDAALARFAALKSELDPDGLLTSELARRLELV